MRRSAAEILMLRGRNGYAIRGYGVRRLGLFGSAAHGAASEQSDLDFVVECGRRSLEACMDLKAYLEEFRGGRVDLVVAEG